MEWGHKRQEQDHIFLLQFFFSYFPLKPRCVLRSSTSYSLQNTVVQGICSPAQSFWVQYCLTTFSHFSTFCFLIGRLEPSSSRKPCPFPKFCLVFWSPPPSPLSEWASKSSFPSAPLSPSAICLPSPSPLVNHVSLLSKS